MERERGRREQSWGQLGVVDGKTALGYVGGLDAGCEQVKHVGGGMLRGGVTLVSVGGG